MPLLGTTRLVSSLSGMVLGGWMSPAHWGSPSTLMTGSTPITQYALVFVLNFLLRRSVAPGRAPAVVPLRGLFAAGPLVDEPALVGHVERAARRADLDRVAEGPLRGVV